MREIEFILYSVENYQSILFWMILCIVILLLISNKTVIAGLIDPFHFYYAFAFGTSYGVVISLYISDQINGFLFSMVALYGLCFIISFKFFSKHQFAFIGKAAIAFSKYNRKSKIDLMLMILLTSVISVAYISEIGLGLLAETNRFESAKGVGAIIRAFNVYSMFLLAYYAIYIVDNYNKQLLTKRKLIFNLLAIVLYAFLLSIMNGAKAALIECLYLSVVGITAFGYKIRITFMRIIIYGSIVTMFALFALSIQEKITTNPQNIYETDSMSPLVQKFVHRILANANCYYLGLPNELIDKIDKDSFFVRILSPVIGITNTSKLLGYNAGDFSVGRQLLLYWNPDYEISGGPVSHFDLFAYKYLGYFGGIFFAVFVGFFLGQLRCLFRQCHGDIYLSCISSLMWVKGLAILIEPTIGIAYVIDVIILLSAVIFLAFIVKRATYSVRQDVLNAHHV